MTHPQLPLTVLMVRPAHFGYNPLTASSNAFQVMVEQLDPEKISDKALLEFNNFVDHLKGHHVDVIVIEDTEDPITPDALFPNNWISFHVDGTCVHSRSNYIRTG